MTIYIFKIHKTVKFVASLVVQWLRLHSSTAGGMGSISGGELGSHMPHGLAKNIPRNYKIKIEEFCCM